jgi:tetratricopeptide (TPR) repeat protein
MVSPLFCDEEKAQNQFFDNALREYASGNFEKAITNLKVAKVSDPNNEVVNTFLVKTLIETSKKLELENNYSVALKYAEEALSNAPDNKTAAEQKQSILRHMNETNQTGTLNNAETPTAQGPVPISNLLESSTYRYYAIGVSGLFFLMLTLLFFSYKRSSLLAKKMETLAKELKMINDDRNLLLTKLFEAKDQTTREKISLMALNLYEFNPGEALNFLSNMAKNTNPAIRSNVIQALATIANPETIEILFNLYADSDPKVKGEALKSIKDLETKIDKEEVKIDPVLQHKIKYTIANEKSKKEWIF